MEERGRGGRGSNRRLALFTVLFGVCALCAISKGREVLDMITFPGSSAGKESACNAGGHLSIPGSGRSPGEGTGYPRQYSWVSLVAQLAKDPPTMWETWV